MGKSYNELNDFVDECINEALKETAGKFQVGPDYTTGIDFEEPEHTDRFSGSEKKKDGEFERPPPYKIYQRPLTDEETRSYKQYEKETAQLKQGQTVPPWAGLDNRVKGQDKTDEYSKYWRPPKGDQSAEVKGVNKVETEPGQKQESSYETPKYESNQLNWNYKPKFYQAETQNVTKPKTEPLYQPDYDKSTSQNYWKPINRDLEKQQSQSQTTNRHRGYSEPGLGQKQETTSSQDLRQTYENLYRDASKSNIKSVYKEKTKEETLPETKTETKSEDKKKEGEPGMHTEDVKKELLKLRPPIMNRAMWGALPPMGDVPPMKPPADTIVFSLSTGTPPCTTENECRRTVRELQATHMGKGLADIQYNFLVGGDGNLYEGRGWAFESGIKPEKQQGKNYNIAFIGNFQGDVNKIPPHMLGPVQELIVWGNAIRLLSNNTESAAEYKVPKKPEN